MTRFALRRLAGAVPLLLAISLVAFGLTALTGGNYFDRYRADRRHDPATVRMLERNARLDRPFLVRWLHWLRGACFDVRVRRPRLAIEGFEEAAFEARVERIGLGWLHATPDDSTELRRSGKLLLPAGENGVRIARLPAEAFDPKRFRAFSLSVRNPGKVARRLEARFEAGPRSAAFFLDLEPGAWATWEIPVARIATTLGAPAASLLFTAPGTGEFLVDDLAAVEDRWTVSAGAPDFGRSFEHDAPVWALLGTSLANSFLLAAAALVFTWAVAIPAGVAAAIHPRGLLDRVFSILAFVATSIPAFFLALLVLFGVVALAGGGTPILPIRGAVSDGYATFSLPGKVLDRALHLLLPTLVLSAGAIAGLQRITRGNLLGALRSGYCLAARAKGCSESRVVYRHALRNAVNPLVSIFGTQLAGLLSGAALVEIVFGYPGVGKLMLDATISKDLYVVMAGIVTGGALLVLGNLLADVLLRVVDPRIGDGSARA